MTAPHGLGTRVDGFPKWFVADHRDSDERVADGDGWCHAGEKDAVNGCCRDGSKQLRGSPQPRTVLGILSSIAEGNFERTDHSFVTLLLPGRIETAVPLAQVEIRLAAALDRNDRWQTFII